ncbi:MAG: PAS domain-containing protein [Bacteroidota bacterium]|nr:PAS domain-containing protein [Bacteroidota bacterium]
MKKVLFTSFLIFLSINIFSQNPDSIDNNSYPIPDSLVQNSSIPNDFTQDLTNEFVFETKLQSQKLQKNLFLAGFIFMSLVVVFLFYINNTKIKQVLEMVKIHERQLEIKNFEVEKLIIILNNTIDGIAIIDDQNNILWNNSSLLELYGYTDEDIRNKTIDFLSSENSDIEALIEKTKKNKKPVQFTFEFKNKNNNIIHIQRRIIPITDQKNEIDNFAIIDTDYTALKLAVDNSQKK